MGEGDRVRLGKAEVGEGGQGPVELVGRLAGNAPRSHTGVEATLQFQHADLGALRGHGLAQFVGLGREKPATATAISINCS
jgi:hypothetical protein